MTGPEQVSVPTGPITPEIRRRLPKARLLWARRINRPILKRIAYFRNANAAFVWVLGGEIGWRMPWLDRAARRLHPELFHTPTLGELADNVELISCRNQHIDLRLIEWQYPGDRDMRRMAERGNVSPTSNFHSAKQLIPYGWGYRLTASESGVFFAAKAHRSHPTNAETYGEGKTEVTALLAAALRAQMIEEAERKTQGENA